MLSVPRIERQLRERRILVTSVFGCVVAQILKSPNRLSNASKQGMVPAPSVGKT
jgi:hypothetical protein